MNRKVIQLFLNSLAILAMLWMGACSAATLTPTPGSSSAVTSQAVSLGATNLPSATLPRASDTPSNATPDVNAGNVTITFANLYGGDLTDYQSLANAFHKQNPTITV